MPYNPLLKTSNVHWLRKAGGSLEEKPCTRRGFLIAAGCCGTVLLFGAGCTGSEEARAAAVITVCPYGYRFDPWPGRCARYVDRNGSGYCDLSEVSAPASASTGGDSAGDQAGLVILCDRGCSYPGQCMRYVDADGSGICDLSEGVPAAQASAAEPAAVSDAPVEQPAAGGDAGLVILCDRACSYPGACGRYVDADGSGICDLSEGVPVGTASAAGAPVDPPGETAAGPLADAEGDAGLVILCDRACSYPGACGRYVDADGSGICDLSEGVPAETATPYEHEGGGRSRRGHTRQGWQ
jgi:hypothetical protein